MSVPVTLTLGLAAFAFVLRRERAGTATTGIVLVLTVVALEAALYPNPSDVPTGLFHPALGALTFRLVDLLVAAAIGARLLARGFPRRFDLVSMLWTAFLLWYAAAGVLGVLAGNDASLVLDQTKPIVYLGLLALVAGIPADQLAESRGLRRLIGWSAAGAAVLIVLDQTVGELGLSLPLLPLPQFGEVGADAGTVFVSLGLLALAAGIFDARGGRVLLLVAVAPLFLAALFAVQRAAALGLAASLVACAALVVWAPRRSRTRPTEVALALLVGAWIVALPPFVTTAFGVEPAVPLVETITETFLDSEERLTAEGRVNQYLAVDSLIAERLWTGWGLGKTYSYFEPGFKEFQETSLTHNVLADILLRMGVIGLVLFLVAAVASVLRGALVWRDHPRPEVAALTLACVGIVAGLATKSLVESLFEKHLLMILLGVTLGAIASAWRTREAPAPRPAAVGTGAYEPPPARA